MSQKFAKNQSAHPSSYNQTFNGSIVIGSGKGRNIVGQFAVDKVIARPSINIPIATATRPVSIPAGSGVYLV
jgi:hypothetical protein